MQEYIDFFHAHTMLCVAWAALLVALIVTLFKMAFSKVKTINTQEATMLINKQEAVVIDVRGKDEFRKGHIVNAVNMPMADIKNSRANLEKHKSKPIILVCNAGMTSSQAAQILVKDGFEQVYSLKGGMGEWQAANMPVSRRK
ncbi:rhodanese-like domain-containing protein [Shewanella sp. A3A]|uniref:Rhodanese-like domain-containing protein n=1 Tax=Shewanella electrica TaxID=515560 RepID=A0ABT2FM70_9GAMM|nr:rhodanese-like domain-containing protein [Shewanella electrica]MCH1921521.1 rhodanese-like domain-containing protein [Shewanella ferrihydritica]MCH1926030.1 rhodanese-like domain-containing protein [Shewanella electrica]MCS4557363.1 rhodanese-like domain-containing protein [Shewanella electrica]